VTARRFGYVSHLDARSQVRPTRSAGFARARSFDGTGYQDPRRGSPESYAKALGRPPRSSKLDFYVAFSQGREREERGASSRARVLAAAPTSAGGARGRSLNVDLDSFGNGIEKTCAELAEAEPAARATATLELGRSRTASSGFLVGLTVVPAGTETVSLRVSEMSCRRIDFYCADKVRAAVADLQIVRPSYRAPVVAAKTKSLSGECRATGGAWGHSAVRRGRGPRQGRGDGGGAESGPLRWVGGSGFFFAHRVSDVRGAVPADGAYAGQGQQTGGGEPPTARRVPT